MQESSEVVGLHTYDFLRLLSITPPKLIHIRQFNLTTACQSWLSFCGK